MSRNYGKIALVAAIAGACGYASAATTSITARSAGGTTPVSVEGIAAATTATLSAGALVNVDINLIADSDFLRLTIDGGSFASQGVSSPSLQCTLNGSGSVQDIVFSLDNVTSGYVQAQFKSVSSGIDTKDISCSFHSLAILASSMGSATTLTGTVVNEASGNTRDLNTSTAAARTVYSAKSQISAVTVQSAFNGVIDFENALGYGFATDDGTGLVAGKEDALVLKIAHVDTQLSLAGTLTVGFAVRAETGKSFAFLDSQCGTAGQVSPARTGATGAVGLTGDNSFSGAVTIDAACENLTVTGTYRPSAATTALITVAAGHVSATPTSGVTIEAQTMTMPSVTLQQGTTSRLPAATGTLLPGAWTSNGSTVQIPYMPINMTAGAGKIDPVVIISNRSTATGSITATVRDEDGNTCSISDSVLGSIAAGRTKSIGGDLRDAISGSTCADLGSVEKVSITLTVTLPSGSTEVYSGYTVGGSSRVTVVNSTNGK